MKSPEQNSQKLIDDKFPFSEIKPVVSSNLKGYHQVGEDLYILFNNGNIYRYDKVPEALTTSMVLSTSPGKFFFANIKDKFTTTEISYTLEVT